MTGYKPGDPERKAQELRAAIADKTMTEDEAADAMYSWAEEVGYVITRSGAESFISLRLGMPRLHKDGPR
jgi:hypothetical protein